MKKSQKSETWLVAVGDPDYFNRRPDNGKFEVAIVIPCREKSLLRGSDWPVVGKIRINYTGPKPRTSAGILELKTRVYYACVNGRKSIKW